MIILNKQIKKKKKDIFKSKKIAAVYVFIVLFIFIRLFKIKRFIVLKL